MPDTPDTAQPKEMTAEGRIANLTRLSLMERHELSRLGRSYGAIEKLTEQKIRTAVKAERERCCGAICWDCHAGVPLVKTKAGGYGHQYGAMPMVACKAAAIREGADG